MITVADMSGICMHLTRQFYYENNELCVGALFDVFTQEVTVGFLMRSGTKLWFAAYISQRSLFSECSWTYNVHCKRT